MVLIIANPVDLSAIASVGSAVSLMVFLLVSLAGWRRRAHTKSNPAIILLGLLAIALDAVVRRQQHSALPPEGHVSPSPTG